MSKSGKRAKAALKSGTPATAPIAKVETKETPKVVPPVAKKEAPKVKEVDKQTRIDELLERLGKEVDQNAKKKIRAGLRRLGHFGGLGERRKAKVAATVEEDVEEATDDE